MYTVNTWRSPKWTILDVEEHNIEYIPYLALCPIESNLPSPLQPRFFNGLVAKCLNTTIETHKDLFFHLIFQPNHTVHS